MFLSFTHFTFHGLFSHSLFILNMTLHSSVWIFLIVPHSLILSVLVHFLYVFFFIHSFSFSSNFLGSCLLILYLLYLGYSLIYQPFSFQFLLVVSSVLSYFLLFICSIFPSSFSQFLLPSLRFIFSILGPIIFVQFCTFDHFSLCMNSSIVVLLSHSLKFS
jgi:hypothetical protein